MHAKVSGLALAAALMLSLPALADQRYAVAGNDRYQIGDSELQTSISYAGTQDLLLRKDGAHTRLTARVQYTRSDAAGTVPAQATFVQTMNGAGELQDRTDSDPDYLTVLNQPFAVMLDKATMGELLHLRGRVPFLFPAPMIGSSLQGHLMRGPISRVDARPALAVDFDAAGPMMGPLPDHSGMSITGTMRMRGTAYYAVRGAALLLALHETLSITGRLRQHGRSSPVTIVYERSIKAAGALPPDTEASSH
ncbi:MAG: hypothetical protein ABR508_05865 [Candidatus Baltobacteraceae bacterium]